MQGEEKESINTLYRKILYKALVYTRRFRPEVPGRLLRLIFARYVPLGSQSPNPIIVYSVASYRPHLSHFAQRRNFRDPSLVTVYLCIYLILNEEHFTFHIQYKHSGTFANRKYEELSHPKNHKKCDPILTLLKMRLNYSQSSRENATSPSDTSPLASYEEVPPPPHPRGPGPPRAEVQPLTFFIYRFQEHA